MEKRPVLRETELMIDATRRGDNTTYVCLRLVPIQAELGVLKVISGQSYRRRAWVVGDNVSRASRISACNCGPGSKANGYAIAFDSRREMDENVEERKLRKRIAVLIECSNWPCNVVSWLT